MMNKQPSMHELLMKYNISPRKSLGQNFLVSENILQKIVQAAGVDSRSTVLEIGPGLGSLTRALAASAGRVTAVELDQNLVAVLENEFNEAQNVTIVHGDILQVSLEELNLSSGYLVVANIPYYITSAIIRRLLEADIKPGRIVLTIQREVANRICAKPNDMSLLSLSVQVYGEPKQVLRIPAEAFFPKPKVDSAVLLVELYLEPLIKQAWMDTFFTLAKAGFSQKRKTLRNALSGGLGWQTAQVELLLLAAGIDPQRRAETLSLTEWGILTEQYQKTSGSA